MPPGPACIRPESGTGCIRVAPATQRVDLIVPVFSNPRRIDNPLEPAAVTTQVLYGGTVAGKPFRTEVTRLPGTKLIHWQGQTIPALISQYMAFSDGRIAEVALDWFAQADDGAVWYLGEDVREYEDGKVATTEGSWEAGKAGPPAMIMPAAPKAGMAYRSENAPGIVFEEDRVLATGRTVMGASGAVTGAIEVSELHADGAHENKIYAPGYGEFYTATNGELEAASLAIPTDFRPGGVPAPLATLSHAVRSVYDALVANRWSDAAAAYRSVTSAGYRPGGPILANQLKRDISLLGTAISGRERRRAHQAALRLSQDDLDLRLRFTPLPSIERARFALWQRQTAVDAHDGNAGAVSGDVASLSWTWARVRATVTPAIATTVDTRLRTAQAAAGRDDPGAAARAVGMIRLG